jgi:hypothetical protein
MSAPIKTPPRMKGRHRSLEQWWRTLYQRSSRKRATRSAKGSEWWAIDAQPDTAARRELTVFAFLLYLWRWGAVQLEPSEHGSQNELWGFADGFIRRWSRTRRWRLEPVDTFFILDRLAERFALPLEPHYLATAVRRTGRREDEREYGGRHALWIVRRHQDRPVSARAAYSGSYDDRTAADETREVVEATKIPPLRIPPPTRYRLQRQGVTPEEMHQRARARALRKHCRELLTAEDGLAMSEEGAKSFIARRLRAGRSLTEIRTEIGRKLGQR